MITALAIQLVKPEKVADLTQLMSDLTSQVRANEPGCVSFEWVCDADQPGRYLVLEQYLDQDALTRHQGTPYLKAFLPKLMECLTEPPQVTMWRQALPGNMVAPPSYFHVGVVVPDLHKAIARYSDVLGMQFTEPATFHIPRLEDPTPHAADLVCAFSMTSAPYYELIQASGDGIYSAAQAGKILYFGIWEPDMAGRLEHLQHQGVAVDAQFKMDEKSAPFAMITAPDLLGARLEYVDMADRGPIEEWVRTGKYPGGVGG